MVDNEFEIFKLAKSRYTQIKGIKQNNYIKNCSGKLLTLNNDFRERMNEDTCYRSTKMRER